MRPASLLPILLCLVSLPALPRASRADDHVPPPRAERRAASARTNYTVSDSVVERYVGVYRVGDDLNDLVTIGSMGRGETKVEGSGWDALGWFGTTMFDGAWRRPGLGSDRNLPHEFGMLHLAANADGSIVATFWGSGGKGVSREERWTLVNRFGVPRPDPALEGKPVGAVAPLPNLTPPGDKDLPRFGEYVYVEELPEAVNKVPPMYPEMARKAGVSGTVMVQALVGKDGLVKDTRIVATIPLLDEAAITAVKQWTFKPARSKGQPVAVWVAIPVKFSLH